MTCKEKLKLEHPDRIDDMRFGGVKCCPVDLYPSAERYCDKYKVGPGEPTCTACWDQEVPKDMSAIEPLQQRVYDAAGVKASTIKDSGDRTEFSTGAVRDMREGKGRCDLMPLDVVGYYHKICLGGEQYKTAPAKVFMGIYKFQETGIASWLIHVLKDSEICKDPYTMFLEVAKHFEDGAKKYGENNWQKGIPVNCYIDSAVRHYLKFLRGDTDERHDRAFVWNILCCIWTVENMPELNNYRKETG